MPYPYFDEDGNELPGPETDACKEMADKVPDVYRRGEAAKVISVGELIRQLQNLPPEMPLSAYGEESFSVVVYNTQPDRLDCMFASVEDSE